MTKIFSFKQNPDQLVTQAMSSEIHNNSIYKIWGGYLVAFKKEDLYHVFHMVIAPRGSGQETRYGDLFCVMPVKNYV